MSGPWLKNSTLPAHFTSKGSFTRTQAPRCNPDLPLVAEDWTCREAPGPESQHRCGTASWDRSLPMSPVRAFLWRHAGADRSLIPHSIPRWRSARQWALVGGMGIPVGMSRKPLLPPERMPVTGCQRKATDPHCHSFENSHSNDRCSDYIVRMDISRLPLSGHRDHHHFIVETPGGSSEKLACRSALGFHWSRPMLQDLRSPYDCGSCSSIRAEGWLVAAKDRLAIARAAQPRSEHLRRSP